MSVSAQLSKPVSGYSIPLNEGNGTKERNAWVRVCGAARTCAGARVKLMIAHAWVRVCSHTAHMRTCACKMKKNHAQSCKIVKMGQARHMRLCTCKAKGFTCASARVSPPTPEWQHMRLCAFLTVSFINLNRVPCYQGTLVPRYLGARAHVRYMFVYVYR